jgi:hypothetical protein
MLIEGVVKLIAAIETFEAILAIAKMNVNYLMMILPKGIHIEFRNMNHPDNMDIEGIDNRHILDDRQGVAENIAGVAENIVGVVEHIVEVVEHIVGVAENIAGVAEHMAVASAEAEAAAAAAVADIDNKHIQDVNDANAVDSVEDNRQQGILQKHSH